MSIFVGDSSLLHFNMSSSITSSNSIVSLTPDVSFRAKKTNFLSRRNISRSLCKQTLPSQKLTLPFSTSLRLFPQSQIGCILKPKLRTHAPSASGTDVALEEADLSPAGNEASVGPVGAPENGVESSATPDTSAIKAKRSRPARKSEMPPVKNEELLPGATFTGKVRSIQPFGAFVDFGAFTDGLVHVSRLSDSFVKDVSSVVTVGQEVTVRLLEVNLETGRIALSMRGSDDPNNVQQQRDSPAGNDKSRPPRKTGQKFNQKSSKFVKGQDLEGTVKNLTRAGAFVSLPEGEEGFLPQSEENNEGFGNIMGGSSLEVGQEVSVRVLRITRGQVTLTMKREEDAQELDAKLSQGVVYTSTNPFVLAFRGNQDISSFLDEREKQNELIEKAEEIAKDTDTVVNTTDGTSSETLDKEEDNETKENNDDAVVSGEVVDFSSEIVEDANQNNNEAVVSGEIADLSSEIVEDAKDETKEKDDEAVVSGEVADFSSEIVEDAKDTAVSDAAIEEEKHTQNQDTAFPSATEGHSKLSEDSPSIDATEKGDIQLSGESTDEKLPNADDTIAKNEDQRETIDSISIVQDELNLENSVSIESSKTEIDSPDLGAKSAESLASGDVSANELETQISADPPQNAVISPVLVKQLREETGAGMMDCKKALSETGGDIVEAREYLRKKGLASADKKSSRATAEGRIGSYIHDSRIGVLIEVNCETDFVARGDIFSELVEDLAMQVAACPQVQYLVTEDVPQEIVEKEKEIESQKEDLLSKPEQIRSKIVDGRIRKRLEELALLEQPFIKDDKVVVKDWVKQTISTIGENIKVKRFVRFNLGEGLEKKSQDFAAEVAAQTASSKPVSTSVITEPAGAAAQNIETVEAPKVAVSAALVKQLREETGAGMMECKKALTESGGDLEKAQEYLRKKGLLTADKKSSRLAAEGRIGSYIHDSRIGVLIEVNCETDFVGRSEKFKELVDDLAMQVVACPQVQYVSIEDIPESIVNKEKQLEMQREDLASKPENIREKIVEGRVTKRLGEMALLEQAYIKDDSVLIKDLVKQTVAGLGENIKVRRFVRFTLGESDQDSPVLGE